jgi:hypothetical protein
MHPDRLEPEMIPHTGASPSREQPLQRLAETADYVSQRVLQLDEQMHEAEQLIVHMGALTRQLRTLASNTTLEATRMKVSGPLAEIARQMRRISQQMSDSNDQLATTLRSYTVATGELRQAATSLVGDAKSASSRDNAEESGSGRLHMPSSRSLTGGRRGGLPPIYRPEDHADGHG